MHVHFTWKEKMLILDAFIFNPLVNSRAGWNPYVIADCINSSGKQKDCLMQLLPEIVDIGIPRELILERLQLLWIGGYLIITNEALWGKMIGPSRLVTSLWSTKDTTLRLDLLNLSLTEKGKEHIKEYEEMIEEKKKEIFVL
ncbi:MAG: hypothetical protein HZA35_03875 [Parcubacteria group bacterium]|nr:hypothetical protein [Parcubacteria group bacterium]